MGNIVNPANVDAMVPDYIHMANWRRLHNAPWNLSYSGDRSFTMIPYSLNDSAVCYYYEPASLEGGESFTYSIFLTTEDTDWYNGNFIYTPRSFGDAASAANDINADLQLMYSLQARLNQFIAGEIELNEDDLNDIERSINGLKAKIFNR
jgi:hypothetical protein